MPLQSDDTFPVSIYEVFKGPWRQMTEDDFELWAGASDPGSLICENLGTRYIGIMGESDDGIYRLDAYDSETDDWWSIELPTECFPDHDSDECPMG